MFVSFLGLPKGASTVTKEFACSLQSERAKFVFCSLCTIMFAFGNIMIW